MMTTATNMETADFGSEMTAADFGSEMTAAQICVDLQYRGVQFREQSCTVLFWKGSIMDQLQYADDGQPSKREKGSDNFYTNMNMNEWDPLYSRFRVVGKLRFPHQEDSFYPKDHMSNKHEHHHLFPLIGQSNNYSRLNLTDTGQKFDHSSIATSLLIHESIVI